GGGEGERGGGVGGGDGGIVGGETVVGEGGGGRNHFGAGDVDAGVGLLLNGDEYVFDLIRREGAVDRRIDDRVVHEQHVFLCAPIPRPRVRRELAVEAMIGPERVHERGLVIGRAP